MKLYLYQGKCNLSGIRIRERRIELQLSQEQLAAKLQLLGLEMNQKAISRIEAGLRVVPDYEVMMFARALDVTVPWLMQMETE